MTAPDQFMTDMNDAQNRYQALLAKDAADDASVALLGKQLQDAEDQIAALVAQLPQKQPRRMRRGLGVPPPYEVDWDNTGGKHVLADYRCYEEDGVIPVSWAASRGGSIRGTATLPPPQHYMSSYKPSHNGSQYGALSSLAATINAAMVDGCCEHEPENVKKNINPTLFGTLWCDGATAMRKGNPKLRVWVILMAFDPARAQTYLEAAVAEAKRRGIPGPDGTGYDAYSDPANKFGSAASILGPCFANARKTLPGKPLYVAELGQQNNAPNRTQWLKDTLTYLQAQPDVEAADYFNEGQWTLTEAELTVWATAP